MGTRFLCFEQKYEKYQSFLSENFRFLEVKFSIYLNRHVFVMTGPSCSKLTMSLVNVSLKLFSLNMAYMLIFFCWENMSSFCICKNYSHFFSKTTCVLDVVLTRTVNILTTNELVKLTTL